MGRRYRVVVSPQAAQALDEQVAWIARTDESSAMKFLGEFRAAAESLETFPLRRRFLDDAYLPRNKYRALLFWKHHLIIYQVRDDVVYIELVVDGHQDYAWLLRGVDA